MIFNEIQRWRGMQTFICVTLTAEDELVATTAAIESE